MVATEIQPAFSNLQLELLKLYALNVSDDDLLAIKLLMANYFAEKAADEADRIWREKNYDADTILNMHLRTPYKSQEKLQA